MSACSLPIVLQSAMSFLESFIISHFVRFGRSGTSNRSMRSDRRNNILNVVQVMLRGCCLQHKGVFCHISVMWARPLSIAEIACMAGISYKTVSRCIADLVNLGLIESVQIKRKNPKTRQFEVSIGIRRFTKKFWSALGLTSLFEKSREWAEKNGKRKFTLPFKAISLKVKNTYSSTEQLVKFVLGKVSNTFSYSIPDTRS